jgi:hypothetical protein
MTAIHEFGFVLAVGGLLLVLEVAFTHITKVLIKYLPEWATRLIAGVLITLLGLWTMLSA